MSGPAVREDGLMIDPSGMRDVVVIASGAYGLPSPLGLLTLTYASKGLTWWQVSRQLNGNRAKMHSAMRFGA